MSELEASVADCNISAYRLYRCWQLAGSRRFKHAGLALLELDTIWLSKAVMPYS
jgi:hypothetical protein